MIGISYSLVFLLATGPSFFYLISVGISQGFKSAAMFATGIILSDIFITAGVYYGLGDRFKDPQFQQLFSLVGGVIILVIALRFLMKTQINLNSSPLVVQKSHLGNFMKGAIMNLFNPFAYLIWIGLMAKLTASQPDFKESDFLKFFIGFFGALSFFEFSKAFLSHKISQALTPEVMFVAYKVLGVVFIVLAIRLFYMAYLIYMASINT